MTTTRRTFLKQSALVLTGAALSSQNLFAATPKAKKLLGVQLYSVRDDMQKNPLATLKVVAAMGYRYVEHANYIDRKFYGYPAKEFKKILKDLGLKMPSGHTVLGPAHWDAAKKDFTDKWKYTVEDAATMGQQFVISPWLDQSLRKSADDLKRYMEVFNKAGELCKKSGMKFGYHNHDFEFGQKFGDQTVYDIILQNTDPELVIQQLDIGNMTHAGANAKEILSKYPGRFPSLHVKDEIKVGDDKYESTILGAGFVNVKEVLDLGESVGGSIHFIIEQEAYQDKTPVASIKEDFDVMKKWGY